MPNPTMTICWFVRALPDNCKAKIRVAPNGAYTLLVAGTANVSPYVKVAGVRRDILLPSPLPNETPDLIFNEISCPETHARGLAQCQQLVSRFGCAVLNAPEKILQTGRHQIANKLRDIPGLRVGRVICCQPKSPQHLIAIAKQAGIDMPFLVREATAHDAHGLTKIGQPTDRRLLHRFAFDSRNYYVSEFLETRSSDGLYRKARIMMVNGKPFLRHQLTSEDWIINTPDRCNFESFPDRMAEEQAAIQAFPGPLAATLDAIQAAIELDYFGIDCHIGQDGVMSLFEANANMTALFNMRKDVAGQARVLSPIIAALEAMITRAAVLTVGRNKEP